MLPDAIMAKIAVILAATSCMRAVADPRCKASGQYQYQPVVFQCDGTGGDTGIDINVFKVAVDKGAERNLFEIPVGTSGFHIEVGAEHRGYIVLSDPASGATIVDDSFSEKQVNQWGSNNQADATQMHHNTTWKGMRIVYSLFLSLPRKERVRFLDPTPGPILLRIKNPTDEEQVFRFRYHYGAYTAGTQCEFGAAPIGCHPFYQASARLLAVQWSDWLRSTYTSAALAWTALTMDQKEDDSMIPYYRWCNVYEKWPAGKPQDCWRVWKFVTHGGFEANVPGLDRTLFGFTYSLSDINKFAGYCCNSLVQRYTDRDVAATALMKWAEDSRQGVKSSPLATGLWHLCGNLPGAPSNSAEYLDTYLDADGYGGFQPPDLEYCWHSENPKPPQTCVWRPPAGCAPTFKYKGATYSACAMKDHDAGWCSNDAEYKGKWQSCKLTCEDDGAAQGCFWKPDATCVPQFMYRNKEYHGCTKVNHNSGWCSLDTQFDGSWNHCTWTCPNPSATILPTEAPGLAQAPRMTSQLSPQAQPRAASIPDVIPGVSVQQVASREPSTVPVHGQDGAAQLRAAARRAPAGEGGGHVWMVLWMVVACVSCVACGLVMSVLSFLLARSRSKPRVVDMGRNEDELPLMPVNSTQ